MNLVPVQISGVGHNVPDNVLTNEKLAKKLGITESWIYQRCGINKRFIVRDDSKTSDISIPAVKMALLDADLKPEKIDLIIFCTLTPDHLCPSTAGMIQKEIGAVNAACFDLEAACSGFIYGLSIAYSYVATGMYENILVVGAEILSKYTDYSDKKTAILFGDGAGAAIVSKSQKNSFKKFLLGNSGEIRDLIYIPNSGTNKSNQNPYLNIEGRKVFKWAVKNVPVYILDLLTKSNLEVSDIDYFVLHQANQRIVNSIAERLSIPSEKLINNISDYGNTGAASIPIILSCSNQSNLFKSGDKILLFGFGAGISWAGTIFEWS